ncbi:nuclear transport factor 2 family protein [Rhizobium sp. GCM10022189]|uniref:nuclear transport factor 2 family protein n=1 Tax=Rhizobium sp. GCM10022189 TaxID=3252654 RepID=UPI00361309D9
MRISQLPAIAFALFCAGASMAASPGENWPGENRPDENRKVIADYYAAYASGDMNRVAGFFADDIEWHIPGHHPLAGTKRGRSEVAAFFRELGKSGFRAELIALAADENWVVDMHRGWSNREGGANVDTVWVLAFRIEDGKIREARNFAFDQAAADSFFWRTYPLKPLPERLAQ